MLVLLIVALFIFAQETIATCDVTLKCNSRNRSIIALDIMWTTVHPQVAKFS